MGLGGSKLGAKPTPGLGCCQVSPEAPHLEGASISAPALCQAQAQARLRGARLGLRGARPGPRWALRIEEVRDAVPRSVARGGGWMRRESPRRWAGSCGAGRRGAGEPGAAVERDSLPPPRCLRRSGRGGPCASHGRRGGNVSGSADPAPGPGRGRSPAEPAAPRGPRPCGRRHSCCCRCYCSSAAAALRRPRQVSWA